MEKNKEEQSLDLFAEEIIDDEVQTNFSCCWGTAACFMTYFTSTAGTASTGACAC